MMQLWGINTRLILMWMALSSNTVLIGCFGGTDPFIKSRMISEVGRKALWQEQYDVAEANYLKAIEEARLAGAKKVGSKYNFLYLLYVAQGRYAKAAEMREKYWQDAGDIRDIWRQHCYMGEIYQMQGNMEKAQQVFDSAINAGEKRYADRKSVTQSDGSPPSARAMQSMRQSYDIVRAQIDDYLGRYYIEIGEPDKAIARFEEAHDLFLKYHLDRADEAPRAKMYIGVSQFYMDNEEKAVEILSKSPRFHAGLVCLTRIYERRGSADQALEEYLAALRVYQGREAEGNRTKRANILNELGGFYFRRGDPEESTKAYLEAKALREATVSATHPNYADTLNGLAEVAASQNELTTATILVRRSLEVLDASVLPTHPRIGSVLVALKSLGTLSNHPEEAAALDQRLEAILQRPLAIWKEDFLWTVDFYAGILQKAGKTAEAQRLRELHARQKDRK